MNVRRWMLVLAAALTALTIAGCQAATDEENGGEAEEPAGEETESDIGGYAEAWSKSLHAVPVVFAAGRAPCAGCHDGRAFAAGVSDPAQLEAGPFGAYVVATDCRTCHTGTGAEVLASGVADNVPSADGPVQGGRGALCMSCHNQFGTADEADPEHGYAHYGPQADVLNGTAGMTQGLELMSTVRHLSGVENTCVGCHMAEGPEGHSFAPSDTQCLECHDDFESMESFEAGGDYDGDGATEMFTEEVAGLMDAVYAASNTAAGTDKIVAQGGEISFVSGETTLTVVPTEAYVGAYNWVLIEHDKSSGIHNPFFTVTLLQETYRRVTGSALPGAVVPTPTSN